VISAELSRLARDGSLYRPQRGVYVESGVVQHSSFEDPSERDLLVVADAVAELVENVSGSLPTPDGYQSSALAVIDAVFSARVRYKIVQMVIDRVMTRTGETDRLGFTVSRLLSFLEPLAEESHVENDDQRLVAWFGNAQMSPGTKTTKARTVLDTCRALVSAGIESRGDFESVEEVGSAISTVPGVGDTTVRYLVLLLGNPNLVKPDVWVTRWLEAVLDRPIQGKQRPAQIAQLVERAIALACANLDGVTAREVDYLIWATMSGRFVPAGGSHRSLRRDADVLLARALVVETAVDWRPRTRRKMYERWHGVIAEAPQAGRALVEWELTDAPVDGDRPGRKPPFTERVPVGDLVICDLNGPLHPHLEELAVASVVDWDPKRLSRNRRHGSIVAWVGDPHRAVVDWTIVDREGRVDKVNPSTPFVTVEASTELALCRLDTRHPHRPSSTGSLVYIEPRPGRIELFRINLGLFHRDSGPRGSLVSVGDNPIAGPNRSFASMNAALKWYRRQIPLVYALNGTDNAWCNFRCAGCHRFVEATHAWVYDHAPYPRLRPLGTRRLSESFRVGRDPSIPPPEAARDVACWLGQPCDEIMGPFG
jgi:hypothetical protein